MIKFIKKILGIGDPDKNEVEVYNSEKVNFNTIEIPENVEIIEFADGKFQVWRKKNGRDQVLRSSRIEWLPSYQSHHDFMFFSNLNEAIGQLKRSIDKESPVRVYKGTLKFKSSNNWGVF